MSVPHESIKEPAELECELKSQNLEVDANEASTSKDTPFSWKSHTPEDLQIKKNPVLEVSENTPSRTSRRRPTTGVKTHNKLLKNIIFFWIVDLF